MFVDELELEVIGGRGGDGMVSFRREKYVPKGGPDGGDGGDGGNVYLLADPSKHSFLDLRYKRRLRAQNGGGGKTKNRHGATGADLFVPVPLGTIVYDERKRLVADLIRPGQEALVAQGGKGGKGNARFASSRRRVPRLAEKGLSGVEQVINLELKLMAQVGLVGFPNAGKSTLLGRISEAKPKTASYPFTTLTPNLGVIKVGDQGSFIMADMPGLIEGAHHGAGLGHQFLRHVERNLLLLFLIDLSPEAHPVPDIAYSQLLEELAAYNPKLSEYPRVVVGNKLDLSDAEKRLSALQDNVLQIDGNNTPVFGISAATGEGTRELIHFLYQRITELNKGKTASDEEEVIRPPEVEEEPLAINEIDEVFQVSGSAVERAAARTDFDNEDALLRFQNYCRRSGLERALKKAGIKDGDTVRIGKEEFTYYE
ncbi:MAG: GTPase ObgE [Firmicutes bacterium]|nr:GTPase ObgE [Bacillota bacterium]